ncbi:MAG: M61 family metallopeptidase [Bacteroidota bacterium]
MEAVVRYSFSAEERNKQYVQIKVQIPVSKEITHVHLPSWRPGRYELGNFAKNVNRFKVYNDQKKSLPFQKINKDTWEINTSETGFISVEYSYYAAELNAGSTFLSDKQLYVNPVNCCVYTEETQDFPCEIQLNVPDSWKIATSLEGENKLRQAANFDELADSPFICSPILQCETYEVNSTKFYVWFNGEIKPDWDRVINDFTAFSKKQIEKFIEFPVSEYHFLIQILPSKAYHGVEHCKSTVITLGPTYEVFKSLYKELLGVSSHELYHTWNVKSLRPAAMLPYDFKKENYSELGYIYEGITTYMGDIFLLKSGVFSLEQYLVEFKAQLQKHFDNPARFNYSVAQSSFDTWLDGYVQGAPGRKVSIYTEGCLLAFVTDVKIRQATQNKYGLDEVMKRLYFDFAMQGKGITEKDYISVLEHVSGISFESFFKEFVHGTQPYESIITESLDYLGLELVHKPSVLYSEGRLGMKLIPLGKSFQVSAMYPGGPAELGGMRIGDEIIGVNGLVLSNDIESWFSYFDEDMKDITFIREGKIRTLLLPEVQRFFYLTYSVQAKEIKNSSQEKALKLWMD